MIFYSLPVVLLGLEPTSILNKLRSAYEVIIINRSNTNPTGRTGGGGGGVGRPEEQVGTKTIKMCMEESILAVMTIEADRIILVEDPVMREIFLYCI